ncbi:excalibur calcium-binding domain-containing protein [Streptomyces sp. NRRL WC-3774]|uniref:excalibur calcium-binding domain-containing protein n=1 Tax=Streptomyces sp. NRRL WC-3774 TaxID=1463937 RepID=UPI00099D3A7B
MVSACDGQAVRALRTTSASRLLRRAVHPAWCSTGNRIPSSTGRCDERQRNSTRALMAPATEMYAPHLDRDGDGVACEPYAGP